MTRMLLRHHYHIFLACSRGCWLEKLWEVVINTYMQAMFFSENKDYIAVFLILVNLPIKKHQRNSQTHTLNSWKKTSKPKFLFIHLGSVFKVRLLISLSYYHVSSPFLFLFSKKIFLIISEKTSNFCCPWIWKKGIDIQYATLSYKPEAWQSRSNLAGFSELSRPRDSHSEHCRKSSFTGTRDEYDNAFVVVQLENASSVHVPIRSNFVIDNYLQSFWLYSKRWMCVKNNSKNIIPPSEQLWAGRLSRRASGLCEWRCYSGWNYSILVFDKVHRSVNLESKSTFVFHFGQSEIGHWHLKK